MSLVPFATGVATQLLVRPFEIDRYLYHIIFASIASFAILFANFHHYSNHSISESLFGAAAIALSFTGGFFASTFMYRAFFHRLHRFPGPFLAKISRFYAFTVAFTTLRSHTAAERVHEKYGDFVRTGKWNHGRQRTLNLGLTS